MTHATFDKELLHSALLEITRTLGDTLFHDDWVPGEHSSAQAAQGAAISINGAWQGRIQLSVDEQTARKLASHLFRAVEADVTPEQQRDTLHELVNIIGGNLKAYLPSPTRLGLPQDAGPVETASLAMNGSALGPIFVTVVSQH